MNMKHASGQLQCLFKSFIFNPFRQGKPSQPIKPEQYTEVKHFSKWQKATLFYYKRKSSVSNDHYTLAHTGNRKWPLGHLSRRRGNVFTAAIQLALVACVAMSQQWWENFQGRRPFTMKVQIIQLFSVISVKFWEYSGIKSTTYHMMTLFMIWVMQSLDTVINFKQYFHMKTIILSCMSSCLTSNHEWSIQEP